MDKLAELPFKLGMEAKIVASGEKGRIIGLAIFTACEPQALLHYVAADGRAVENWWQIDKLLPA